MQGWADEEVYVCISLTWHHCKATPKLGIWKSLDDECQDGYIDRGIDG